MGQMMIRGSSALSRLCLCCALALLAAGSVSAAVGAASRATIATAQPAGGTLIEDVSTGRYYLIWDGVRHAILTSGVLAALGLNPAMAGRVRHAAVAAIPAGSSIGVRLVKSLVFPLSPLTSGRVYVSLSIPAAPAGAAVTVAGSGFGSGEAVRMSLASAVLNPQTQMTQVTSVGPILTLAADVHGRVSGALAIPVGTPAGGILQAIVEGTATGGFAVEPLAVLGAPGAATITPSPKAVLPGGQIAVIGSGFAPNEQVNLFLAGGVSVASVIANGSGGITAGIAVPVTLSIGTHSLIAYGAVSRLFAETSVIVGRAGGQGTIRLSRYTASPGSLILVGGTGFLPDELVNISFNGAGVIAVAADSHGAFKNAGFTVPGAVTAGSYTVTATGASSGRTASAALTVVIYSTNLTITPSGGVPGTAISVSGSGFAPGEVVTLALNSQALETNPRVIVTSTAGAFSAVFILPTTALAGANALVATGETSRAVATAVLSVALPTASTWYFAGGDTRAGADTQIALVNPNGEPAAVRCSFMSTDGSRIPYTLTVAARSRATINVNSIVGGGHAVFSALTADRRIGAEETVYRSGQDFSSTIGASAPLKTWYLAEGYTGLSFHEYIRLFNPGAVAAHITLRLLPTNGEAATTVPETVNAQSGLSVDVNAIRPNASLSAIAESDEPIVVDRLMTFGPNGYGATEQTGIHTPASTWLFAEGSTLNHFETYLTVLNPNAQRAAVVTATFFDQRGTVLGNSTIVINPLRRGTIKLNDYVHSSGIATILSASDPVVAERPLYFGAPNASLAGGSDVFGRNGGGVSWLFPEGNTSGTFREFLLLQNQSAAPAQVRARFFRTDGPPIDYAVTLPPRSRATIDVLRDVSGLPPGRHGALVTSLNGVPIIAEQSIYADNFAAGDGTAGIAQ